MSCLRIIFTLIIIMVLFSNYVEPKNGSKEKEHEQSNQNVEPKNGSKEKEHKPSNQNTETLLLKLLNDEKEQHAKFVSKLIAEHSAKHDALIAEKQQLLDQVALLKRDLCISNLRALIEETGEAICYPCKKPDAMIQELEMKSKQVEQMLQTKLNELNPQSKFNLKEVSSKYILWMYCFAFRANNPTIISIKKSFPSWMKEKDFSLGMGYIFGKLSDRIHRPAFFLKPIDILHYLDQQGLTPSIYDCAKTFISGYSSSLPSVVMPQSYGMVGRNATEI